MAIKGSANSDKNDPASKLMVEALGKASLELEKAVQACVEQLREFTQRLEESLKKQLEKVYEQSKSLVDLSLDDLVTHREELLGRLTEFERTETDNLNVAWRDLRDQVTASAREASETITKLVEERMKDLEARLENPERNFPGFLQENVTKLESITSAGKGKIVPNEAELEAALTSEAKRLEQEVTEVVQAAKHSIETALSVHHEEMEGKIAGVVNQLSELATATLSELGKEIDESISHLDQASAQGKERLRKSAGQWKSDCDELKNDFNALITSEASAQETNHNAKLEHKSGEMKDEISQIAQDGHAKIAASHKLFSGSLKRLEKRYKDRLERLLAKFEATLADETKLPQAPTSIETTHELRELLHARLDTRSKEIVKSFRRQIEQIEAEYARYSMSSCERLETIKSASTESLEKNQNIMTKELDRVVRSLNNELSQLTEELPRIEEAGSAAAFMVATYRDAKLSFGSE